MVTQQLARFLTAHRPEDVPERVRHEAKRSLVNFFATALGGCRHEAVEILVAALAERRPITGAALLHAFVLGVEVECRMGNALSPAHYRRGWHITATCGVLGSAAAAGKLLGLDAARMAWALGAAATQSSGLIENLGTMSKSVGVGNSARNGLAAALYAERGLTGPDQPLEGPRGLAAVMGEGVDLAPVTPGLGET